MIWLIDFPNENLGEPYCWTTKLWWITQAKEELVGAAVTVRGMESGTFPTLTQSLGVP